MAPVVSGLAANPAFDSRVCVTAQHRSLLDQALDFFQIQPDYDLDLMRTNQSLSELTARILLGMKAVLQSFRPDWVLVQGDTTTALATALAASYKRIPIAHVEAGLRTGNRHSPWPEENNRRMIACLASLHFAPTEAARVNLMAEGHAAATIHVTGNTVIDALLATRSKLEANGTLRQELRSRFGFLDQQRHIILVTAHRRENWGDGLNNVCQALRQIAEREDVTIVYPAHPNPHVQEPASRLLTGHPRIHVIPPLTYPPFVYLMSQAHHIITDSGGIQEEAPALGKPVLIVRDTQERPEAVAAGTAELVGLDTNRIVAGATRLLDDEEAYRAMARAHNPFGDGHAATRIVALLQATH